MAALREDRGRLTAELDAARLQVAAAAFALVVIVLVLAGFA